MRSTQPGGFEITGAKHKALFALLATAPFGRRTRPFLQDTLWGTACYDTGRQSLRRALSDIKQMMGDCFGDVLSSTNSDLTLDLTRVSFIGRPGAGQFLEGINIRDEGFVRWLEATRQNPEQIYSLYSLSSQPPPRSMLPAIAVLPFRTMAERPAHDILGDWLAEEICRSLSRSNLLAVISHFSSRALNNDAIDIPTVRARLAVDYCVVGTLRVGAREMVLDADFLETASGRILWTRQFVGAIDAFLSQSSEGIAAIVSAIGRSVADDSIAHVSERRLADLEDHRLLLAGVGLMHRASLREFAKSRELIEEALRRAPHAAEAHAWRGKWHILSVFNGWSTDAAKDTQTAVDCTARALDISPDNAFCLTIDGFAHNNLLRRLDIADERYSLALRNNPNSALSWLLRGTLHAFRDEGVSAVEATRRACRLSPLDPFAYFFDTLNATAHLALGDYARALELAERSLARNDRHISTLRTKIVALHNLGRLEESRRAAAELLVRQPGFTVSDYRRNHPAADFNFGKQAADALSAAGIP
ncbi:tetratricopeptide repeat protein [Bradyrhizobium sp. SSBR45R]|uniref:tetratricopeptide repeat protein n=1 Tax=Bradyrhizobium sp. SSBR45R TaxID=2996007 RepID=UPI0024E10574|nr:tetratricopeptide repeat protein [Bradyrhizobium sp. SSBR45R]